MVFLCWGFFLQGPLMTVDDSQRDYSIPPDSLGSVSCFPSLS